MRRSKTPLFNFPNDAGSRASNTLIVLGKSRPRRHPRRRVCLKVSSNATLGYEIAYPATSCEAETTKESIKTRAEIVSASVLSKY